MPFAAAVFAQAEMLFQRRLKIVGKLSVLREHDILLGNFTVHGAYLYGLERLVPARICVR